jgi:allantoicase
LKLGTAGTVVGFDIDTTTFNGNEAPEASVEAMLSASNEDPMFSDCRVSSYGCYAA